jgi:tRNA threonylcarbamoyladenosine biosynthesis protein TsaB
LSAVKGLAEVLGKPIATVSVLEALATLSPESGSVAVALDAGRKEVFWGLYQLSGVTATRFAEELLSQSEFVRQLRDGSARPVITSDVALAELAAAAGAKARLRLVERQGSELIARVGLRKLLAGETVSVDALDANYIRRSDAELFSSFKGKP